MNQKPNQYLSTHEKACTSNIILAYGVVWTLFLSSLSFFTMAAFQIVPIESVQLRLYLLIFFAVFSGFSAFAVYLVMRQPIRVSIDPLGNSTWWSPLRVIQLSPHDLLKITENERDYSLYSTQGKLNLNLFTHKKLLPVLKQLVEASGIREIPDELKEPSTH